MKYSGFIKNLDERVKLLIALTTGIAAIASVNPETEAFFLCISLLLCSVCGAFIGVIIFLITITAAVALIFLIKFLTASASLTGIGLIILILKFGTPCAMMVFIYKTINTSLFLRSLEKMKVPHSLLISVGVTIRFIPSLVEEFDHIKSAMVFRGIKISLKTLITRPFQFIEYVLMPLLMRCLIIGEELSRSLVTRGISYPGQKTSFYKTGLKKADYISIVILFLIVTLSLLFDYRVLTIAWGNL